MFGRNKRVKLTKQQEDDLVQGQINGLEQVIGILLAYLNDAKLSDRISELNKSTEAATANASLEVSDDARAKGLIAHGQGIMLVVRHISELMQWERELEAKREIPVSVMEWIERVKGSGATRRAIIDAIEDSEWDEKTKTAAIRIVIEAE